MDRNYITITLCIKICGVEDIADAVAMRTDKFIKRFLSVLFTVGCKTLTLSFAKIKVLNFITRLKTINL